MSNKTSMIGVQVVSVDDPGRRGRIVGGPRSRSDALVYLIKWDDGLSGWTPEYAFEKMDDEIHDDVFTLLEKRKFGRLNDLRRNLTFILLGGRLANVVYSMDATNTEFLPYQFKPVLTFLESPSNGILIADEVGLGKTIEAGLIWTELRARFHSRRLVVICPAILRDKWVLELNSKFGVDARILNAGGLTKELGRNKNHVPDGIGYVCSLQGLRPPSDWNLPKKPSSRSELAHLLDKLKESEPVIDLLVIDEAHYLRNPETQNAELGNLLREVSEFVVLLSATPINNKSEDLHQLLHLIDPDSFYSPSMFAQILSANEPLVKARNLAVTEKSTAAEIRENLERAHKHDLLKDSRQLNELLSIDLGTDFLQETANRVELASRIDRINLLRHTLSRTRKIEVQELKVVREASSHFVDLDPNGPERHFYDNVTQAVRQYAIQRDVNDGFLLSAPQRQMSSCMYAAARSWRDRTLNSTYDSDFENLVYEDQGAIDVPKERVGPLIQFVAAKALHEFDIESLRSNDTKFEKFKVIIDEYFSQHPKEKLIVFSYFKATLHYLHERLSDFGYSSQVLHGGVGENKQTAIDRFRESEDVSILLTSEIASEGVDLQFCSLLINYDLPWNPMKIEQRIGRIDRIGQIKDKILIWNMGYTNTIDEKIYKRLLLKLDIFERALGSLESILGRLISELTSALLSQELTSEQEQKRIEQTCTAVETEKRNQQELEAQAGTLIAHGDYILQQVKSAHEFKRRITDHDLKVFVKDYLDRHVKGFEFLEDQRDSLIVSMRFPPDFAIKYDEYITRERLLGKSQLGGYRAVKCRFLSRMEPNSSPRIEIINQFHPLIRFISDELRKGSDAFYSLVACTVPRSTVRSLQSGIYAFVTKRWSFKGLRTEEALQTRASILEDRAELLDPHQSWNLVNATKANGRDWLSVANDAPVDQIVRAFDKCDLQLQADYRSAKNRWDNENLDRVSLQHVSVERHRDRLLTAQRNLLIRYEEEGQQHLIRMTKGRIEAIEGRFGLRIESLRSRNVTTSTTSDICYGVIQVTD